MELEMLWSFVLTTLLSLVGWAASTAKMEIQRLQILLNKTREEIARDYITRAEVSEDMLRLMAQLERLDEKLDRVLERRVA